MTVDFNFGNDHDELSDGTLKFLSLQLIVDAESVQSPTLHTDLGIDRNELVRRLKQNIQNGQQDGYPFVPQPKNPLFTIETNLPATNGITTNVPGGHCNTFSAISTPLNHPD
jgi:hypothetical protein